MSGRKPFRELAARVSATPEGRARVDEYRRLIDAIVTLYRLREQRGLTQVTVANALDVTQGNVSRVESATDLYVSTLARYVEALGGQLELNAVFPDQVVSLQLSEGRPSALRDRPTSLAGYVEILQAHLRDWATRRYRRELPEWTRVLLIEDVDGQRADRWAELSEFEPRFREILTLTSRDWINLHAESIEDRTLKLVLEYLTEPQPRAKRRRVTADVSVNISGPEERWWDSLPTAAAV